MPDCPDGIVKRKFAFLKEHLRLEQLHCSNSLTASFEFAIKTCGKAYLADYRPIFNDTPMGSIHYQTFI